MSDQRIRQAMRSTEEATKALARAYANQVARWSTDLTEQLMINMDEAGKFSPIVRRSRYLDGLIKTMSPQLLEGTHGLLLQAGSFSIGELSALPGAGDVARPSLLALENVAAANYQTLLGDMAHVTTVLKKSLKVEIEALFVSPKSMDLSSKILAARSHLTVAQAKTIINTSMAAVQRDVHQAAFSAMPDKKAMGIYMGPDDAVTRPFCEVLVNRVIKQEYFSKLKNDQKGANSFVRNGGGWNCRHRLMPITASYAKRNKLIPINIRTVDKANSAAKASR